MAYFIYNDEAKKHLKKDDEVKESMERQKSKVPEVKQIECPNCKTLNEPDIVVCISCGENIIAAKQKQLKDFSVLRTAKKKRRH